MWTRRQGPRQMRKHGGAQIQHAARQLHPGNGAPHAVEEDVRAKVLHHGKALHVGPPAALGQGLCAAIQAHGAAAQVVVGRPRQRVDEKQLPSQQDEAAASTPRG